jgi:hypothetical protein
MTARFSIVSPFCLVTFLHLILRQRMNCGVCYGFFSLPFRNGKKKESKFEQSKEQSGAPVSWRIFLNSINRGELLLQNDYYFTEPQQKIICQLERRQL